MKLEQANKKAAALLAKLGNTEESLVFLKSIPFWCGHYLDPKDKKRIIPDKEKCCYNHWLGLPKRWNQRHPLYEYETNFIEFLSRYRKLFAEKAAGLGITELVLRWLEYQALTNPEFDSAQIELVSGPNKVLAKELISRMVGLKEENQDFHDLGSRGIARDITDYSDEQFFPNNISNYISVGEKVQVVKNDKPIPKTRIRSEDFQPSMKVLFRFAEAFSKNSLIKKDSPAFYITNRLELI
jgi:hypothetical protein